MLGFVRFCQVLSGSCLLRFQALLPRCSVLTCSMPANRRITGAILCVLGAFLRRKVLLARVYFRRRLSIANPPSARSDSVVGSGISTYTVLLVGEYRGTAYQRLISL